MPTFVNENQVTHIAEISQELTRIITQIPEKIFNNNLSLMYQNWLADNEIPEELAELILLKNLENTNNFVCRGDFILTDKGFKCLEYNVASNIGGWQAEPARTMYLQQEVFRNFIDQEEIIVSVKNPLLEMYKHVINIVPSHISRFNGELNLAVFYDPKDSWNKYGHVYSERIYKRCLSQSGLDYSGKIVFCTPDDLNFREGCVFVGNLRIHALIDQGLICPIQVYLSQSDGFILLFNGLAGHLLGKKSNLGMLKEPENMRKFSSHEQQIIDTLIPETHRINSSLMPEFKSQFANGKDNWVLKQVDGSSGQGVWVGKETELDEWVALLNKAFDLNTYIIQEYVESIPITYRNNQGEYTDHNVIWGFFISGNKYSGGFLRVSEKGNRLVINSFTGARESYMLEIESN